MQFLNSPIWAPLNVVVAIILGVLTLRPPRHKALTYRVITNLPLTSLSNLDNQPDAIDLRFRGTSVTDARIVVVRLWNSGNVPIGRADYDKPIRLQYYGRLVTSVVSETIPEHLRDDALDTVDAGQDEGAVQLCPMLLNPGDSLTITSILADSIGTFDVQAHITGTKVERYDDTLRALFEANKLVIVLTLIAGLVGLNNIRSDIQFRSPTGIVQDVLYLSFIAYVTAFIIYRERHSRRELYYPPLHRARTPPAD